MAVQISQVGKQVISIEVDKVEVRVVAKVEKASECWSTEIDVGQIRSIHNASVVDTTAKANALDVEML